jgi:hypothetical protein
VQTEFLCNHRANELAKFIKNIKKFTDVLLILLYLYIKFHRCFFINFVSSITRGCTETLFVYNTFSYIYMVALFII